MRPAFKPGGHGRPQPQKACGSYVACSLPASQLWPWVWATSYNWQYVTGGCWINPVLDWRKREAMGSPWPALMSYSRIPQNTLLLLVPWQSCGTWLLILFLKPPLLSQLLLIRLRHVVCVVRILAHVMFGHSWPRCSWKSPQVPASIFRH